MNYELVIAVQDSSLMRAVERSMRDDMRELREITLDDVEPWSPFARVRDRLATVLRKQI